MPDQIDNLISLLFRASRIIRERTPPRQRLNPVSILRFETLNYIREQSDPTMLDVAHYLSIRPPSATSLISSLVGAGFIIRQNDAADHRVVRLRISSKGRRAIRQGYNLISTRLKAVFKRLGRDDQMDLVRILKRLSKIYNT